MAEPERTEASRRRRIGCLALLVAAAAVIGGGVWLGLREDAGQTPCERYTHAAERALANCHSGYQDHPWLLAQCEEAIEVDDGCLERLKALSCEAIERNPAVVLDVCRKKP